VHVTFSDFYIHKIHVEFANSSVEITEGSNSLASFIASDVAISWLAGDVASMIELG
ncbi:hypothetical protein Tco_1024602, partial [Tanacetum coccineum]